MSTGRLGAVVLAAGASTRLAGDAPKQALRWRGRSLVAHAVCACLEAADGPVVVVTGAHAGRVTEALTRDLAADLAWPRVRLAHNGAYADGMRGSLRVGLRVLLAGPTRADLRAAFVTLADQPLVDAPFLRKLTDALTDDTDAAALAYPSGAGVPALIRRVHLDTLAAASPISGRERGARALLRDPSLRVCTVNEPARRRDIDTLADYAALLALDDAD